MEEIYLDNSSGSATDESIADQMKILIKQHYASSFSPCAPGQRSFFSLSAGLQKLYELMGANPLDSFYLSQNSSTATADIIFSLATEYVKETGRTHFLTTDLEEAPTLLTLKRIESIGCFGKTAPVNKTGQLSAQALEPFLRPRVAMLSVSWACGLTGVIQPIEDIAKVCKEKGVLLHVDASYVIGKQFFRFEDIPVSFMTFEGSCFGAPQGCTGMFVKAFTPYRPLAQGARTESVAQITALSEAVELAAERFDAMCTETARLRDRLEKQLMSYFPELIVPCKEVERLPNIACIAIPGVVAESLLFAMNSRGVYGSMGGGHMQKLSHILSLMGFESNLASAAVSFSLSHSTTEQQVDKACSVIVEEVKKLKSYSQYIHT